MDNDRLYTVTRECAGNRLYLINKTKQEGYDSTILDYEEFENIKDIDDE